MGEQQTKRTVTGRELKWIAVLSMTLDHIGAVLVEPKIPDSRTLCGGNIPDRRGDILSLLARCGTPVRRPSGLPDFLLPSCGRLSPYAEPETVCPSACMLCCCLRISL